MTAEVIGVERRQRGKFWRIACRYWTMPGEEADGVARTGHGAFVAVAAQIRVDRWASRRKIDGRPCDRGDIIHLKRPITVEQAELANTAVAMNPKHADAFLAGRPVWAP